MLIDGSRPRKDAPGGEGQDGDSHLRCTPIPQEPGAASQGGPGGADIIEEQDGTPQKVPGRPPAQEVIVP
jgi:hypothetical protein